MKQSKMLWAAFFTALFFLAAGQCCLAAGGYELQDIIMDKEELYLGQGFTSIQLKVKNVANVSPQTKTIQYFVNNNPVGTLADAPFQGGMGTVYNIDLPISVSMMSSVTSIGVHQFKVVVENVGEINKGFTVLPAYELKKIILIRTDKYGSAELSAPVNYLIMGNYYKIKVMVKNLGPAESSNKKLTVSLNHNAYFWNTLFWSTENFPAGQGNEYYVIPGGSLFAGGPLVDETGDYKVKVQVHGIGDIVRDITIVQNPIAKYNKKLADVIISYFKYQEKRIPDPPPSRPEGEQEGADYAFQFGLWNKADEGAENAEYIIQVDGRTVLQKKIVLSAGRQERFEETLRLKPGRHTVILKVTADNDRDVKDNTKRLTVSVKQQGVAGGRNASQRIGASGDR
jgi:hypothetical protein